MGAGGGAEGGRVLKRKDGKKGDCFGPMASTRGSVSTASGAGSSLPRRELETEGVASLDVYITKEWFPVLSFK